MEKTAETKTIYYSDELNDDFAGTNIKQKKLPDDFKYVHKGIFYRIGSFILTILAVPFLYLFLKVFYHQKFVNKKKLRKFRKTGYFIYANHTNGCLDAYIPQILAFPKKAYIVVNPDATSIFGIRTVVMMLGGLPLPTDLKSTTKYLDAIKQRIKQKSVIMIYPEAHIWPYYTDIRHFRYESFIYPARLNKPVFALTNVYVKRKHGKRPKVVSYIDGPFFIDPEECNNGNMVLFRDVVYDAMKKRVNSNPVYKYKYDYVKKEAEE